MISVSAERWCRLRGNLLFYFKSREKQSEPAGVIVLENIRVSLDTSSIDGTFGLLIHSGMQKIQHLRSVVGVFEVLCVISLFKSGLQ